MYLILELCTNGELFSYIENRSEPLSEDQGMFKLLCLRNTLSVQVHIYIYIHIYVHISGMTVYNNYYGNLLRVVSSRTLNG